jgi:hypothetical protein
MHGPLACPFLKSCQKCDSFFGGKQFAGRIGVKLSHALRMNPRRTWRPSEGSWNVYHTAIRCALSPSRPCGNVTAGVHG